MLRLYDTRTRQVETIEPARRGRLSVYSCGPTVYRYAHVGNLRSFLLTDLIPRTAERHRLLVTGGQNITDVGHLVDDTEIDPAGRGQDPGPGPGRGSAALDVARFYEDAFHADLAALNIHPADSYPRACESIDLMIDLIGRLIETGHAYVGPERLGVLRRAVLPLLRRAVRQPARRPAARPPVRGRRPTQQALPRRLGAVEAAPASGRETDWDSPVGHRLPRLAHRVLGDVAALPGRDHRRAHRRHRPALPAPRGRARPVRRGHWPRGRPALGARRAPAVRRPQDGEVHRQRGAAGRSSSTAGSTRSRCGSRSSSTATASR